VRTFIGIGLPRESCRAIAGVVSPFRGERLPVSWTPERNLHLTLKFLGEIPSGRVDELAGLMAEAARDIPPFVFRIEGAGGFPTLRAPRVLWIGILEPLELVRKLHENMENALSGAGFSRDERQFHPHVTVGRVKGRVAPDWGERYKLLGLARGPLWGRAGQNRRERSRRMSQDANRRKALDMALAAIEKSYGKGAIMRLGTDVRTKDVPAISTGAISLDIALGIGGIPRGRVTEIFGPESSGKTTLALHIIAEAQKQGGIAGFIDAEHALDLNYARKLGLNTDDLLVSQPDTGEQALEIAEMLVRSGALDILVIDSVAALVPKAEIEGEMGDSHMGLQARLMSQALRKLTGTISKSQTAVIFINQIRMKIGVMFGNPETTTGGNALKFYSTIRLDIRRITQIKKDDGVIGARTRVKVVKNKLAPPFREAEFDIIYGEGISREGDILDLGSGLGVVEKSGSWYSVSGERIGQGRENARVFLKDHPDVTEGLCRKILEKTGVVEAPKAAQEGKG
jgi:recombination protein RecA